MNKPKNKKVKKQYLAGTSGKLRTKRKAALKRLNKDNKGTGVLPGDKKSGKFIGSKKESKHNKKFERMYG
jgi:ribosomal protein L14E/L6E/L27E